jgi:hypothetical protein
MSDSNKSLNSSSRSRTILLAGVTLSVAHFVIAQWLIFSVLGGTPLMSVEQYNASALLGAAAFAGGVPFALLGLLLHFLTSLTIAAVFILSLDRFAFLQRRTTLWAFLYGFGVFIVMNFIVVPLSAAPTLDAPPMSILILVVLEHILVVGGSMLFALRRQSAS